MTEVQHVCGTVVRSHKLGDRRVRVSREALRLMAGESAALFAFFHVDTVSASIMIGCGTISDVIWDNPNEVAEIISEGIAERNRQRGKNVN